MLILLSYNILLPCVIFVTIVTIIVFVYRADKKNAKSEPFSKSSNNTINRNKRQQVSNNNHSIKKIRKKPQNIDTDNTSKNISDCMIIKTPVLKEKISSNHYGKLREANGLKDENKQNEIDYKNTDNTSSFFHKTDMPNNNTKCCHVDENNVICGNTIKQKNSLIHDKTTCELNSENSFEKDIVDLVYNRNKKKDIRKSNNDFHFCFIHIVKDPIHSTLNSTDTVDSLNEFRLNDKETGKNSLIKTKDKFYTDKLTNCIPTNDLLNKREELDVKKKDPKDLELDPFNDLFNKRVELDVKKKDLKDLELNPFNDLLNKREELDVKKNDPKDLELDPFNDLLNKREELDVKKKDPNDLELDPFNDLLNKPEELDVKKNDTKDLELDPLYDLLNKREELDVKKNDPKDLESGKVVDKNFFNSNTSIFNGKKNINSYDLGFNKKDDNVNVQHLSNDSSSSSLKKISKHLTTSSEKEVSPHSDKNNFNNDKPHTKSVVNSGFTSISKNTFAESKTSDSDKARSQSSSKTGMNNSAPPSTPLSQNLSETDGLSLNTNFSAISHTPKTNSMVKKKLDPCVKRIRNTTNKIHTRKRKNCPNQYDRFSKEKTRRKPNRLKTDENHKSSILNPHTEMNNESRSPISFEGSNHNETETRKLDSLYNSSMLSADKVALSAFTDSLSKFDDTSPELKYDNFLGNMNPNDIGPLLDCDFFVLNNNLFDNNVQLFDMNKDDLSLENDNYEEFKSNNSDNLESDESVSLSDFNQKDPSIENNDYDELESKDADSFEKTYSVNKNYYKIIHLDSDSHETPYSEFIGELEYDDIFEFVDNESKNIFRENNDDKFKSKGADNFEKTDSLNENYYEISYSDSNSYESINSEFNNELKYYDEIFEYVDKKYKEISKENNNCDELKFKSADNFEKTDSVNKNNNKIFYTESDSYETTYPGLNSELGYDEDIFEFLERESENISKKNNETEV